MSATSSRREFLVAASLAGAALVTGGGAGCAGGKPEPQVRVDEEGRLIVLDPKIAAELGRAWAGRRGSGQDDDSVGIPVRFTIAKRDTINSLCRCRPSLVPR